MDKKFQNYKKTDNACMAELCFSQNPWMVSGVAKGLKQAMPLQKLIFAVCGYDKINIGYNIT